MCRRCALLWSCPDEVRGPYGRACWLAFGSDLPRPDCERFVPRDEVYWRAADRQAWREVKAARRQKVKDGRRYGRERA